jgi:ABC-2 type transport system ATP-binding protein
MPAGAEPLVAASGLSKRFGAVLALDAVDLEIPPGAVGLLGPNGSGKTTLIRLMLGLTAATAGSLSVLGLPAPARRLEIRRRVGYAPETESHFPAMTAIDAVTFAARLSGLPGADAFKRAHELLNFVGLDEARYRRIETFSTGMKQRVKIAQALVHDPALVVLDEPTAGLDAGGRDEVLDLIRDVVQRRGPSVLLSTHILGDVERVCSHAVLLHQGRVVGGGPLGELVAGVQGRFDVRIDGDAAAFRRGLAERAVECAPEADGRLVLRGRDGELDPVAVFEAAAAAGVVVRHFAPRRLTLEEAFLERVS